MNNQKLRKDLITKGFAQAKKYEDTDSMIDEYIEVFEKCMEVENRKDKSENSVEKGDETQGSEAK